MRQEFMKYFKQVFWVYFTHAFQNTFVLAQLYQCFEYIAYKFTLDGNAHNLLEWLILDELLDLFLAESYLVFFYFFQENS